MAVTTLMNNLAFRNGDGIGDLVKDGVGPLREYAGMITDYAESNLDSNQQLRLYMIKDLMIDQIDALEETLFRFKYEAEEAAAAK